MRASAQHRASLVLLALAGALLVLSSSRWVSGGEPVLPALGTIGWLLLASVGAVVATGGLGRVLVGVLLVGVSGATLLAVVQVGQPVQGWGVAIVVGAVLALLVGIAVTVRGRAWPTMSSRFGRDAGRDSSPARSAAGTAPADPVRTDADVWHALDRGEDPTAGPDGTEWPHERESR